MNVRDARDNGITFVRLALALVVLTSHAFVVGGFGLDPLYALSGGQLQGGSAAVIGFFGLSGFLLARSREGLPVARFMRNRLLRIVPALWACVAVVVVVVAPLASAMGGRAEPAQLAAWALGAGTFQLETVPVVGMYAGNALPDWVNGPLWTLSPELLCYLVLAVIPARVLRGAGPLVLAIATGANLLAGGLDLYRHLPVAFFAGVVIYTHRDLIPISGRIVVVAATMTAIGWASGSLPVVAPLTLPFLCVYAGLHAPIRMHNDLSYGVYIYAWPVQQLLAMAGLAGLGIAPYLATTVAVVIPVALLSWVVVERPALRLRAATSLQRVGRSRTVPSASA